MDIGDMGITEITEVPARLDLTPKEVEVLADELVAYHAEFADLYYRVEQARWGYVYLQGLLAPIESKAIQPMAMSLEGGDIQAMQQFIGQGQWTDEALLKKHWVLVNETLGEEDGVWIPDGSGFPKKGAHSAGVARQWCGQLGKVENCQVGVFAAYASRQGYTLLDRRLYLPEAWFDEDHRARWEKCGIPDETLFQTEPALALEMLKAVVAEGTLDFRWVACDEAYGKDPAFLDGVADLGRWYFAEVPHNTRVWQTRPRTAVPAWVGRGRRPTKERLVEGEPAPQRVDAIAAAVPQQDWRPYLIKEGSKGPMVAEFAFRRVVEVRDELPGREVWLVLRRALAEGAELKTYLSIAPSDIPHPELVRIAGMRWPVETALEDGKDGLGMDEYMVRSWIGWHHHMTVCILAHHFLVRVQKRLNREAPALTVPQARLLIASVLPLKRLDPQEAIRRIQFIQKQNHAAYLSHRKRTIERLEGL
jgi:SRSO17 transposase